MKNATIQKFKSDILSKFQFSNNVKRPEIKVLMITMVKKVMSI